MTRELTDLQNTARQSQQQRNDRIRELEEANKVLIKEISKAQGQVQALESERMRLECEVELLFERQRNKQGPMMGSVYNNHDFQGMLRPCASWCSMIGVLYSY